MLGMGTDTRLDYSCSKPLPIEDPRNLSPSGLCGFPSLLDLHTERKLRGVVLGKMLMQTRLQEPVALQLCYWPLSVPAFPPLSANTRYKKQHFSLHLHKCN